MNDFNNPCVLKHLEMLQGIINRMALCSSNSKQWGITLITAIGAIAGITRNWFILFACSIPLLGFMLLDAYYLAQEKVFISMHKKIVNAINSGEDPKQLLFNFGPEMKRIVKFSATISAISSFSIWGPWLSVSAVVMILAFIIA